MPQRPRTVPEKVSDWLIAYNAIREEVTPPPLRKMLAVFNETVGSATTPAEGIAILQQSMALARLISANDRMSAIAAAMLTSSGGQRHVVVDDAE
ncbi:MAG TPA: hypothetical protein VFI40_04825 [Nocardioides sp.]|nr:hypothetical protein [Nocardioides sp.]